MDVAGSPPKDGALSIERLAHDIANLKTCMVGTDVGLPCNLADTVAVE